MKSQYSERLSSPSPCEILCIEEVYGIASAQVVGTGESTSWRPDPAATGPGLSFTPGDSIVF